MERPSLLDKAAVATTHCSEADLRIDLSLKVFSFKLFPAHSAAGKRNQSDLWHYKRFYYTNVATTRFIHWHQHLQHQQLPGWKHETTRDVTQLQALGVVGGADAVYRGSLFRPPGGYLQRLTWRIDLQGTRSWQNGIFVAFSLATWPAFTLCVRVWGLRSESPCIATDRNRSLLQGSWHGFRHEGFWIGKHAIFKTLLAWTKVNKEMVTIFVAANVEHPPPTTVGKWRTASLRKAAVTRFSND